MHTYSRREAALVLSGSMSLVHALSAPIEDDAFRGATAHLSGLSQQQLATLWREKRFQGILTAAEAQTLLANENCSIEKLLVNLLPIARLYSRPPVSDFRVGAIARSETGNLYFGANLELPPNILGCSVHAEQSATSNAFMAGETGILDVAVNAAPCGHCRQFLHEMVGKQDIRIVMESGTSPLSALLPSPFGPKNLGQSQNPFSNSPHSLRLVEKESEPITQQALTAAARSYAPYSKSPSGVAIETTAGVICTGSYIENVAFNPSLSPILVALAAMIRAREPLSSISKVVLVERERSPISQLAMTRSVLDAITPNIQLARKTAV